ncbi:hypothetical protein I553_2852 [Mycobacterium xenopi 4042]|uniref:Uncharacterized protein n=1 Tax=Mycobacterium xenopi 4042 TaxID=1299334 RepID=X8EEX6_MYCXE|nr:hypothetical protein I553_2852 [Mycobacterium xenopi 4042]
MRQFAHELIPAGYREEEVEGAGGDPRQRVPHDSDLAPHSPPQASSM